MAIRSPAKVWSLLALVASSGVALAAGWDDGGGAKWADLLAKAKQEGPVVVAGCPEANVIARAFKADTGLDISWVVGDQTTVNTRYRAEIETGRSSIDVQLGGANDIDEAKAGRLTALTDVFVLPNVLGKENWADGRLRWVDNSEKYLVIPSEYVSTRAVINKDVIDPAKLHSLADLQRPEFRGKIAAFDPTIPGSGQSAAAYFASTLGIDAIQELYVDQAAVLSTNQQQLAEWAARGLYPIILGIDPAVVNRFRADGVTSLVFFTPDDAPGSLNGGCSVATMPKTPPHAAGAAAFVNWYLSANGQKAFVAAIHFPSRRLDVPPTGVPDYFQPNPKIAYLDQYQEDWYLTQRNPLRDAIRKILAK